jgi:hypothetical protein
VQEGGAHFLPLGDLKDRNGTLSPVTKIQSQPAPRLCKG